MDIKKSLVFKYVIIFIVPVFGIHPSPTDKLWNGIVTSNAHLVRRALSEGANIAERRGKYGDTPLMASIRIYCYQLAVKATKKESPHYLRTLLAFSTSILIGATACYFKKEDNHLMPIIIAGAFFAVQTIPFKTTPASTKIVTLLIEADTKSNLRNKEGITALDILNSYFPYAHLLQDENWYTFSYLLLKKGT